MSIAATTVLSLEQSAAEERAASDRRTYEAAREMLAAMTWVPSTIPALAETRAIFDREREERKSEDPTRPVLMHPDDAAKLLERQDGGANRGTLSFDLGPGSGPRRRR